MICVICDILKSLCVAVADEDVDELLIQGTKSGGGDLAVDFGWLPSFPHVLTASMTNFLFGYHIGLVFSSICEWFSFQTPSLESQYI